MKNTVVLILAAVSLLIAHAVPAQAQPSCMAVVQQHVSDTSSGTHYIYGWSWGQPTEDAAIAEARNQADQRRNGEQQVTPDVVLTSSCDQLHGALAVQPKGLGLGADIYWYTNGIALGNSEDAAKAEAINKCISGNTQTRIECVVIGSW